MLIGFVGLLDVLGFSALISGGDEGARLKRYLECINTVLGDSADSAVDYVVFSDNIVLTTRDDAEASFQALLARCSTLFGLLLGQEIALRGAIAHGSFFRESSAGGVFVAGRAVVDAYTFETKQDWVGIMLAPSALRRMPDLAERCAIASPSTEDGLKAIRERLAWAAFVQTCFAIPFHSSTPFENSDFNGFAIVPTHGVTEFAPLRDSLGASLKAVEWLKSLAPDPPAQAKYQRAHRWLFPIYQKWHDVAYWSERFNETKWPA